MLYPESFIRVLMDYINMPKLNKFSSNERYYGILFSDHRVKVRKFLSTSLLQSLVKFYFFHFDNFHQIMIAWEQGIEYIIKAVRHNGGRAFDRKELIGL